VKKLKTILADTQALEAYRTDPFSPHAIARLRLNAYQKAIVMKYIDNLIDWGDNLFAQDTRESITEAEMLYQLASEISWAAGRRRWAVCETAADRDLTYERIAPEIGTGSSSSSPWRMCMSGPASTTDRVEAIKPPSTWVRCSRRRSPRELRKWPKRRTSPG